MTAMSIIKKTGSWVLTIIIAALIGLITFFMTKRVFAMFQKKQANEAVLPAHFDSRDTIQYAPVLGHVLDTASDMTVNALLSGGLGPAVVMIYADWCRHCTDMMPAFEEAAVASGVQFVRIQGVAAPVTCQKHKVLGFPTILGIHENGTVMRFNDVRTSQKLLEFASSLMPSAKQMKVTPQVVGLVGPQNTGPAGLASPAEDTIVEIPDQIEIIPEVIAVTPNVSTVSTTGATAFTGSTGSTTSTASIIVP
jgi:thiol-disulfide isomerase/thioredoxin